MKTGFEYLSIRFPTVKKRAKQQTHCFCEHSGVLRLLSVNFPVRFPKKWQLTDKQEWRIKIKIQGWAPHWSFFFISDYRLTFLQLSTWNQPVIGFHLHPNLLRLNSELFSHHLPLCPPPPRLNEEARVRGVCLLCGEHVGADSGHVQGFLSAGVWNSYHRSCCGTGGKKTTPAHTPVTQIFHKDSTSLFLKPQCQSISMLLLLRILWLICSKNE